MCAVGLLCGENVRAFVNVKSFSINMSLAYHHVATRNSKGEQNIKNNHIKMSTIASELFQSMSGNIEHFDPTNWYTATRSLGDIGQSIGVKRKLMPLPTVMKMSELSVFGNEKGHSLIPVRSRKNNNGDTRGRSVTSSLPMGSNMLDVTFALGLSKSKKGIEEIDAPPGAPLAKESKNKKKNSWWDDFKTGFKKGFTAVTGFMGLYDKLKNVPVVGEIIKAATDLIDPEIKAGLDIVAAIGEAFQIMAGNDPDKVSKTVTKLSDSFQALGGNEMVESIVTQVTNELEGRLTPLVEEVDEYIAQLETEVNNYAPISLPRAKEYIPDFTQDIHTFIIDHAKEGGFKVATKGLQAFDAFINQSGDLSYSGHARDVTGKIKTRIPMSIGMTHAGGDLKGSGVPGQGSASLSSFNSSLDTRYIQGNVNSEEKENYVQEITTTTTHANVPTLHQRSYAI